RSKMPENNDRISYRNKIPNSNSQNAIVNRLRTNGQRQIMDFTSTQELKIRAGDVRMARMQISLAKLRQEMEQSMKLVDQLCQEARLD
ncbi:hypothetical protein KR215_003653, partial [Drosophila sulfurigaster]